MKSFDEICAAAKSIWGIDEVDARLIEPLADVALRAGADKAYLSLMLRRIFRADLKHSMVDGKWPAFEEVFARFAINAVRMFSDEMLERIMQDKRIIRRWGKIRSVRANARAMFELLEDHVAFGSYLADWPLDDAVGLWDDLKITQSGGHFGPYFLRMAGCDPFILTDDVMRGLHYRGAYQGRPTGKKARQLIQSCFNSWHDECQRPYCQISLLLVLSTR